jgi:hypothetical protein
VSTPYTDHVIDQYGFFDYVIGERERISMHEHVGRLNTGGLLL